MKKISINEAYTEVAWVVTSQSLVVPYTLNAPPFEWKTFSRWPRGPPVFFSTWGRWLQADPEMEAQARVAARARDEAMELVLP